MSGSRPSNVVPMPMTTTPPTPPPMPSPMWWGGAPPGCAPPGGGAGLAECYWQVQAATAFISAIMIDAINNNPAVTQAIIDAIVASGSNLPLIGVTNGADAQAGQVGEWVLIGQNVNYPTTAAFSQTITMGIIQPGDWDIWIYASCPNAFLTMNIDINPIPVGLTGQAQAFLASTGVPEASMLVSPQCRLLCSVPTLIPVVVLSNQAGAGPAAGTLVLYLSARRRR